MKKLLSAVTSFVMSASLMTGAFAPSVSAAGGISVAQPNVSMDNADVSASKTASDDVVITGDKVKANPGEEVEVNFVLEKVNSNKVASLDLTYKCDAGLEMVDMDTECAAYGKTFLNNPAIWQQSVATLDSSQDPMLGTEGKTISTVYVKAPSKEGTYKVSIHQMSQLILLSRAIRSLLMAEITQQSPVTRFP